MTEQGRPEQDTRCRIVHLHEALNATNEGYVTFDARIHAIEAPKEGKVVHLTLRDNEHFVDAAIEPENERSTTIRTIETTPRESLVRVTGHILLVEDAPSGIVVSGSRFVLLKNVVVLGKAIPDLGQTPMSHGAPGEPPTEYDNLLLNERLNSRVLDLRVAANGAVIKLFSGVYELTVEHLLGKGFHWITTPSLIGYKVPGDHDYFQTPYFEDRTAFLTQTGELHLAQALSAGLERIFEIHTVFRREARPSSRHLTEFVALEVAFSLQNSWLEVLEHAESLFVHIINGIQQRSKYRHLLDVVRRLHSSAGKFKLGIDRQGRIPRLRFSDAKRILRDVLGFTMDSQADFSPEEEKALGLHFSDHGLAGAPPTDMFFITHYPQQLRPYNVYPADSADVDQSVTHSFDVILGGQEAASGFQAINDYEMLRTAMLSRQPPFDLNDPQWRPFLSAYEAGAPRQGGFGIGLNRLVQSILGLPNIHETVLFPRDSTRLAP